MVTTHRITAELYEDDFKLIALHCSLSGHTMAYHINGAVKLALKRTDKDLDVGEVSFPVFEWEDPMNYTNWTLIANAIKKEWKNNAVDLFSEANTERTHHLIEERKEVDYFLKIAAEDEIVTDTIVAAVKAIPDVVTAYSIEVEVLKSRRNLIF
ncbi:IPExxxVDY family protein [uncultured Croceitalea sp.]|uniref:IPExxxVDY family protein n=1 Tax=uncultured Croceitalea sp. TaxID=1798908 RepID=UPI003305CC22